MRFLKKIPLLEFFFFGNYFYGLCVIGLSVEASLQQNVPLNNWTYYLFVFCCTAYYYTHAYRATDVPQVIGNKRSAWYARHPYLVKSSRYFLILVSLISGGFYLFSFENIFCLLRPVNLFLILVFPLVSLLYYGVKVRPLQHLNLRHVGWLKPFVIGFVWAGAVTVYPVLFYSLQKGKEYAPQLICFLLFIKNFMFVTVLSIMFDIKDYAMDYNKSLKTFVVKLGLRKTIFYIIIPLSALGLISFLWYGFSHHFSFFKMLLNVVPFAGILLVAYSLRNRKSILYYLIIIDGLMLLKALCGSMAMAFF